MTKEAPNQEAAEAFYEFILSDDAMTIFESYGFTDYRSAE
ncbi:MAG: substrate-binding domain-containing protein [Sellimonas intestinalis]